MGGVSYRGIGDAFQTVPCLKARDCAVLEPIRTARGKLDERKSAPFWSERVLDEKWATEVRRRFKEDAIISNIDSGYGEIETIVKELEKATRALREMHTAHRKNK